DVRDGARLDRVLVVLDRGRRRRRAAAVRGRLLSLGAPLPRVRSVRGLGIRGVAACRSPRGPATRAGTGTGRTCQRDESRGTRTELRLAAAAGGLRRGRPAPRC